MAVKRFGANHVLGVAMIAWSAITLSTGFIQNYSQAIAVRVLLGAFEAGLVPSVVFIISTIWERERQSKRVAIIYACNCLSGAFGGLIAVSFVYVCLSLFQVYLRPVVRYREYGHTTWTRVLAMAVHRRRSHLDCLMRYLLGPPAKECRNSMVPNHRRESNHGCEKTAKPCYQRHRRVFLVACSCGLYRPYHLYCFGQLFLGFHCAVWIWHFPSDYHQGAWVSKRAVFGNRTRLTFDQQIYLATSELLDHSRLRLRNPHPRHRNIHLRPSEEKSSCPSHSSNCTNHRVHHCLRHSQPCSRLFRHVPLRRRYLQLQLLDPHMDLDKPCS